MQATTGGTEFQRGILYEDSRKRTDSDPTSSALHLKALPYAHMFNINNHEASEALPYAHMLNVNSHVAPEAPARSLCSDKMKMQEANNYDVAMEEYRYPDVEGGGPHHKSMQEDEISVINHVYSSQKSDGNLHNVSQPPLVVTIAVPGSSSTDVSKRKASSRRSNADRLNRLKISGGIKALGELLPHSEEDSKASILDNTIEYIKYLQLQIKMLSQSRLGGEVAAAPFIHLEGHGHYLFQQSMLNEPLEEMIGKLMEMDFATATQLLDSKGLSMVPIPLVEEVFPKR